MTTGDEACALATTVLELSEVSADLDLAAAIRGGIRSVRLTSRCEISAGNPHESLALVRLLREAACDHIPVEWRGQLDPGIDPAVLFHLAPPQEEEGSGASVGHRLQAWRERHQPGLCYYRLGPGFVFVKDVRIKKASARYRLEGADVVESFRRLESVVSVDALDEAASAILTDLEAESLALRFGGLATLLPSQMRRWPVPAHEV